MFISSSFWFITLRSLKMARFGLFLQKRAIFRLWTVITLFRGGFFTIVFRGGYGKFAYPKVLYEEIMLWTWNLVVLTTFIRTFDFRQKNFTGVMTSSDFPDDVSKIGIFEGFIGGLGKIFTVDLVFVAWSWLTPRYEAKRWHYIIQLQLLTSSTIFRDFGVVFI